MPPIRLHDLVRVRTDCRKEQVFCYRVRANPEMVRRLFRIYLDRINQLADRPEWYHLLSNSWLAKLPQAMASVVARLNNHPNRFHPDIGPALSQAVTLAENLGQSNPWGQCC